MRVGGRQWQIGKKSASDISTMHYVTHCVFTFHTQFTNTHTYTKFIIHVISGRSQRHSFCIKLHKRTHNKALFRNSCFIFTYTLQNQLIYKARTHMLCFHKYASVVKTMLHVKSTYVSGHLNPLVDKCLIWPFS